MKELVKELQIILIAMLLVGFMALAGAGLGSASATLFFGRDKVCVKEEPYYETIYDEKGRGYEFIKYQCAAWRVPYQRYNERALTPPQATIRESPKT